METVNKPGVSRLRQFQCMCKQIHHNAYLFMIIILSNGATKKHQVTGMS